MRENLKKQKKDITNRRTEIELTAYFLMETMQVVRQSTGGERKEKNLNLEFFTQKKNVFQNKGNTYHNN